MRTETKTEVVDLGTLDLGNNHHAGHLFTEIASNEESADALLERLGNMEARADVTLTYVDKYRNKYENTWDVGELYDHIKAARS